MPLYRRKTTSPSLLDSSGSALRLDHCISEAAARIRERTNQSRTWLTLFSTMMLIGAISALCFGTRAFAELKIITASDLHYIAPSITDGGAYYQKVLESGDSKFMPYCEEICSAFLSEVIEAHPDALILTGDLTFNGSVISHEALAEKLRHVEDAGIPVLVLTGNHDVYNRNAAKYTGDQFSPLPFATTVSFREIYSDYGLNEAISVAPDSLSYVFPLDDSTWILALDLNTEHDFCGISEDSLAWAETRLKEAASRQIRVIACGHQNIFQHSIFRSGYVFEGSEKIASLFRSYGIPLYLSGHLHIQHVLSEGETTEITTSALCSYPCQYGMLEIIDGALHYSTAELDMAKWADQNGRTDEVFTDFRAAAAAYMKEHLRIDVPLSLDTPEMTAYLDRLNLAYFSGDLRDLPRFASESSVADRLLKAGDLTSLYISSVLKDSGKDFRIWNSKAP